MNIENFIITFVRPPKMLFQKESNLDILTTRWNHQRILLEHGLIIAKSSFSRDPQFIEIGIPVDANQVEQLGKVIQRQYIVPVWSLLFQ